MNVLGNLFGGGQDADHHDFINRYEQGAPHEGYSDEEVYNRYQQVSRQVPQDVYQESAQEAFSRMSPQERMQFAQYMQQQSRQQNSNFPDLDQDGQDDRYQDPRYLAQATSRMHQQQPDMLSQLLGGATGGLMGGGGGGNVLSNPLAKAAMAGIAAIAAKKMMGGGGQRSQQGYGNVRPASEDPYGDPADYR
jgi:hypothetical protein